MTKNKNKENDIPLTDSEVAEIPKTGTAVANTGAQFDYTEFAGQGFESHTRDDYAVPFLGVIQSNSPIIETSATAKAGMLLNTVTQETYDGKSGIGFIPAHTDHVVVEWKPRNQGGGFVGIHQLGSDLIKKVKAEQEFGKWKMTKGDEKSNDLVETFYVYGIFVNDNGSFEQMIISFSSTKIKVYRRWMTKARTVQVELPDKRRINPPIFAHKYRITTLGEKNAKGSFYNFQIDFDQMSAEKCRLGVSDPLFQAAYDFATLIKSGAVKAAFDTQNEVGAEPEEESEVPFK